MQHRLVAAMDDRHLQQFERFVTVSGESRESVVSRVSEKQEDAFFVCDLGVAVTQITKWRRALPSIAPFYAVKCNEDPKLLALFDKFGIGFDCASKGEIERILSLGIDASRVIYANPCKQISHLKFAANHGVDLVVFDSSTELLKIKKFHPHASLVLRIFTDDSQSVCQLGMKFGAAVEECEDLLQMALYLNLNVVGVSFHVGSGCLDATAYRTAIRNSSEVFKIAERVGHDLQLLDIGGGFPGFETVDAPQFEEIAEVVNESLREEFDQSKVTVIAEPGRFFAAACFTLNTCVIAVKPVTSFRSSHEEPKSMVYVNDGVYGSFNCLMYDHAVVVPKSMVARQVDENGEYDETGEIVCSVWGPSCDGLDKIADSCLLPAGLEPGDWLTFDNMGAYTMSAASTFNGFPKTRAFYYITPTNLKAALSQVRKPWRLCLSPQDASEPEEETGTVQVGFENKLLPVVSF